MRRRSHTSEQLEGCWIELVDGGIDVYGRPAFLAVQPVRFPIIRHGPGKVRSSFSLLVEVRSEGLERPRCRECMRCIAVDHLQVCTGSRRVAGARRGESATVPAIFRVRLVLALANNCPNRRLPLFETSPLPVFPPMGIRLPISSCDHGTPYEAFAHPAIRRGGRNEPRVHQCQAAATAEV